MSGRIKHLRRRMICFFIGHRFIESAYFRKNPPYTIKRYRCNTCGKWGDIIDD